MAIVGLSGWMVLASAAARAQAPLADVLTFLFTNQAVPTGDFARDAAAALAARETVGRQLQGELALQPVSPASPGFVYRLNPGLGTPERASEHFGPFFTERSLTTGAGRLTFGATWTRRVVTRLGGRPLRDATLVTSGNQFRDEPAPFDVETLSLAIESRTLTLTALAGVHERVDVGVVVPVVSLDVQGRRVNTYRGTSVEQASADATASGLGDVALRSKVRLVGTRGSGLAGVVDVRLPTGREADLLGAGRTALLASIVASAEAARVAVHGSAGVARGGAVDGWQYQVATTIAATRTLTIVGELLGRRLDAPGRIVLAAAPHPSIAGVDTLRLVPEGETSHTLQAALGAKWNLTGTWLIGAHAFVPVAGNGLRIAPTLTVGIEYSIGR
ncbi:hypothetical protein TBR22_A29660 [Luteitalea sp. TBR-22]|nr:hypothetical protein TBR22_A29660 [Luteitalea sp. TBR-22]